MRLTSLITAVVLLLLLAVISLSNVGCFAQVVITDDTYMTGADTVHLKVISDLATGQNVSIVWDVGGRVEELYLLGSTGLRKVLATHDRNATAVKANAHWQGELLVPYANRIANATYTWNETQYTLPMNEPARNNSIHGLLWDKRMNLLSQTSGDEEGTVVLSFTFNNTDPGYPFKLDVQIHYTLNRYNGFSVRTVAKSLETAWPLPFYHSWHPYFLCNVHTSYIILDPCTPWNHVDVYNNSNLYSNLIPTGRTTPWNLFDGSEPIGGSVEEPTYFDDEFKATQVCPGGYRTILRDGLTSVVLWQEASFRFVQVFTGSQSQWGLEAVAIEPMSGKADAFNNYDGLSILSAGDVYDASFGVYVQ
eukprot:m.18356 g.18356  ORF g.18356 m.18356 type:complete len:363 (+) comp8473_c1_seq1:100-1188(+)